MYYNITVYYENGDCEIFTGKFFEDRDNVSEWLNVERPGWDDYDIEPQE